MKDELALEKETKEANAEERKKLIKEILHARGCNKRLQNEKEAINSELDETQFKANDLFEKDIENQERIQKLEND